MVSAREATPLRVPMRPAPREGKPLSFGAFGGASFALRARRNNERRGRNTENREERSNKGSRHRSLCSGAKRHGKDEGIAEIFDPTGAPVQHGRAPADGIRMHQVIAGRGGKLLLDHGTPKTSCYWHKLLPLPTEHFAVVAPTCAALGFPASSRSAKAATAARAPPTWPNR